MVSSPLLWGLTSASLAHHRVGRPRVALIRRVSEGTRDNQAVAIPACPVLEDATGPQDVAP